MHLVLAVFYAMSQVFFIAHLLIFLKYEFDRFYGIVVRYRDECSKWVNSWIASAIWQERLVLYSPRSPSKLWSGDAYYIKVYLCAAPAVMVYCADFDTLADQLALAFFGYSGVSRVARFNARI